MVIDYDTKGLIRESYRIDGITLAECRSIFLDWAINLPGNGTAHDGISTMLALYESDNQDHPMSKVLREGLAKPEKTGRRGGRGARVPN
ncbi:MAG: hypothetical protein ABJO27_10975 [Pseudoruegeria sp.]